MSNFKFFKNKILSMGLWGKDDIYFSQIRDGYIASYKPSYPLSTEKDVIIQKYDKNEKIEMVIFDNENKKFISKYFDKIEDIAKYFNKEQNI